ncbi:MAG: aminomethyl-transferring glycine dehydrogenase subunit GcvPA [Firmicutes bacterium]|nr:aminomethyl-transferring glycine dehydrogenase subunit GcvPA [Bacillota bacterium]
MKNSLSNYIPNTKAEQQEMLDLMGYSSLDELFADIPTDIKLHKELALPAAMSEPELYGHMKALAKQNINADTHICFMGGGVYDHFIPAVVGQLTGRQEFYTAYTPYQAEISQGTLQAIFEYQTMISRLTGMDVSNASLYDGATACAEAMLMANAVNDKTELVIAGQVHPQYIEVCQTYANYRGIKIICVPFDHKTGTVELAKLAEAVTDNCMAVLVQNPNYFGFLEDLEKINAIAKAKEALLITSVDPLSLAILEPPASYGADIVVGEGQALGNAMNFGGPGFGFFACKNEFLRKMPGRVVGQTTDAAGNRGFILTMQAREQHIRREKSTSNICSNQALCALAATVYMSAMGKQGLINVAELCLQKSHYMYKELLKTGKFEPLFTAPFFKEFALKYTGGNMAALQEKLLEAGFMPGIDVQALLDLDNCLLIAVTEKRTKAEIDAYVKKAGEV